MPSSDLEKKLAVRPLVTRLVDTVEKQKGVSVTGIVGPSDEGILRLYLDPEFNTYLEMPRDAVIEALEKDVNDLTYVTVFAPESTRIACTAVTNLHYLYLQQQMQDENRRYSLVSNIMKTKHDTANSSTTNVR